MFRSASDGLQAFENGDRGLGLGSGMEKQREATPRQPWMRVNPTY